MRSILLLAMFWWSSLLQAQVQFAPSGLSLAEYEAVDNCALKVTYALRIVPDPRQKDYVYEDIQVLEVGTEVVKSYSYLLFQQDSTGTALVAKGAESVPQLQKAVLPMDVYRYAKKQQVEVIYRTILSGPVYRYVEPMEQMTWTIQPDEKTILGYMCRKAVTTFRGRTYTAWFTMDIPTPYGPYKFGGLPGLILSISDADEEYSWNCIGIKKGETSPIKKYKWEYTDISRKKLASVVERMYADPVSFIAVSMGATVTNQTGKSLSMPYNPLER